MSKVASLGYLIFEVSDIPAWKEFAGNVLGLMVTENGPEGTLTLRMDGQAQRFGLEPGSADDLIYAGFEVNDQATLEGLTNGLAAAGFEVVKCDSATAAARGVEILCRTQDPNGLGIELFCHPIQGEEAFVSELVPGGFVTGDEGLGHVVVNAQDHAQTEHFYRELLGMKMSDRVVMKIGPDASMDTDFYHTNSRHHSLAFAASGMPKKMHHFMIEACDMDAVGRAYDRVQDAGVRVMSTLGRHTNDKMFSFYARSPSRFEVEFGWGGIKVDDANWQVAHYDRGSIWGHQRPSRPKKED